MKCELHHDDGSKCHAPTICTITTDARREVDREFTVCETHAREVMSAFDVRDVDGFALAEIYGADGEAVFGSLGERLADLKGRAA